MTHTLKTTQPYFDELVTHKKSFEIRKNDRNFQVGDILILKEWDCNTYTGNSIEVFVTYILRDLPYVPEGYVCMSIRPMHGLLATVQADNAAIRAELERVTKERDAAVADMNVMALAMRESDELSEGCCFACVCDAQNLPDGCILPYGECPGYEKDDCFDWRGIQSDQKGE